MEAYVLLRFTTYNGFIDQNDNVNENGVSRDYVYRN